MDDIRAPQTESSIEKEKRRKDVRKKIGLPSIITFIKKYNMNLKFVNSYASEAKE